MLLKLYDMNHRAVTDLQGLKDAKVESELGTGEKKLSFSWHQSGIEIPHEYYIRTDQDEFVVKENSQGTDGWRSIVAELNTENLESRIWKEFTAENCTAKEMADYALTGTGWTCVSNIPQSRVRTVRMIKATSYTIIRKLLEAFTCEVKFDTIGKVVYLFDQVGEDRGAYFIKGLNLTELKDKADSYDYATRIIPIGADGIGIESVNNGISYLENCQYSTKIKTIIWEDSNYTDPQALKEDAEKKLSDISKPKKTLQAKTIDLARMDPEYGVLSYSLGDTVLVIDQDTGVKEKQRIVKTVEYLEDPTKNTCEISNTVLSFEEMQQKFFAAAECIGNITTNNGTVKGSSVDKISASQIIGMDKYLSEDLDELRVNYIYAETEIGTPSAVIGKALLTSTETTTLTVTELANLQAANVGKLDATEIYGERAKFAVIESDNISALKALIDELVAREITVEYLQSKYATVENLTALNAEVGNLAARSVTTEYLQSKYADIESLKAVDAKINKITASEVTTQYLESYYAKIDYANVDTAAIRQGFLESLMVSQGMIANRIQAGEITATDVLTGVKLYADDIIAGTLSVERLILRGNNKSLVYALNNSGGLVSQAVNTLDAYILTQRTITADKIVAGSITASEINVGNLISNGFIGANKLTANNINVNNLLAQTIVATGSIQSGNYRDGSVGFSYAGLKLDMLKGSITSKEFYVDDTGSAKFKGTVEITGPSSKTTIKNGEIIVGDLNEKNRKTTINAEGISGSVYGTSGNWTMGTTLILAEETTLSGYPYVRARLTGGLYIDNMLEVYTSISVGEIILRNDGSAKMKSISGKSAYFEEGIGSSGNITSGGTIQGATLKVTGTAYFANGTTYYVNSSGAAKFAGITGTTGTFSGNITSSGTIQGATLKATGNAYFANGTTYYVNSNGAAKFAGITGTTGTFSGNITSSGTIQGATLKGGDTTISGHTIGASGTSLLLKTEQRTLCLANSEFRPSAADKGAVTLGSSSYKWGQVYSTKSAISTSDRERKKNIRYLSEGQTGEKYEKLFEKLKPCLYMFKDPSSDRVHSGFISQDIEEVMEETQVTAKEFAAFCKDEKEPGSEDQERYSYSLRYEEFIALNTHMIQKTRREAEEAKEELRSYKEKTDRKISELEEKINKLESMIKNII